MCSSKFTRKNNVGEHMLTHSGEKPFQCGTCDYNNVHTEAIYKDVCTYIMERSPSNVKYVVISLHQEMFYKYI